MKITAAIVATVIALAQSAAFAGQLTTYRCADGTTQQRKTSQGACSHHGGLDRAPTASTTATTPARASSGKVARSESAKLAFMKQTGHPKGWTGHVVDHMWPLCAGGADAPSNMQWQDAASSKAKDRDEDALCAGHLTAARYSAKYGVTAPR